MCETCREKEGKRGLFTAARWNSQKKRTPRARAGAQQSWVAEVENAFHASDWCNACPDKIEGWGMCNKACSPQNQAFAFANMNLLTDNECKALTKWVGDGGNSTTFLQNRVSFLLLKLWSIQISLCSNMPLPIRNYNLSCIILVSCSEPSRRERAWMLQSTLRLNYVQVEHFIFIFIWTCF